MILVLIQDGKHKLGYDIYLINWANFVIDLIKSIAMVVAMDFLYLEI